MAKKSKVVVKKTVAVQHGLDISNLSSAQLAQLSVDVNVSIEKNKDKIAAEKLAKLKESGKFEELKTQFKELIAQAKEMSKGKISGVINIPLQLEYTSEFIAPTEWDTIDSEYPSDLYDKKCSGGIAKNHDLNKKQLVILKPVVEDYVQDACEVIFDLLGGADQSQKLAEQIINFRNKIEELGVTLADL